MKSTSGKHLTTVTCNDYALKTFEEAWESKPSGGCPLVLLHESVSIRSVFFISQSQNECHVPAGIIWLSLFSRLLSTSTWPPTGYTKTGRAAKYTVLIYACSCTHGKCNNLCAMGHLNISTLVLSTRETQCSLERIDRRMHHSITHGIREQNGEQKGIH